MRLDQVLVTNNLCRSRSQAQDYIKRGLVFVNEKAITKTSHKISNQDEIRILSEKSLEFVSRAANKLNGALSAFQENGLIVTGKNCLDIGASTGGFTQILLSAGAKSVIALDVGHGQLNPDIANHRSVIEMSGYNARNLAPEDLSYRPDLIVADVSFISLKLLLGPMKKVSNSKTELLLMVKPQFEVGKSRLGKNGVVTNSEHRQQAVKEVIETAKNIGLDLVGGFKSALPGPNGNQEYFIWLKVGAVENETNWATQHSEHLNLFINQLVDKKVLDFYESPRLTNQFVSFKEPQ